MKKFALVLVLVLVASSAFAANQPTFKSWNKDGQFNIDASVGWALGFTGSVALELIIAEFKIGPVPFDFGVAVRGAFEVWPYYVTGIFWGVGPLATLHMGLGVVPLEFFVSIGVALYNSPDLYYLGAPIWFGFASVGGMMWHLSPAFALLLEGGYVGGAGVWGIGIELQL